MEPAPREAWSGRPDPELHRPGIRFIFGYFILSPILVNPSTPPANRAGHRHPGSLQRQRLRPLKSPFPVRVRTDDEGLPAELHQKGKRLRVVAVRERWRIDDEWWRDPISREYYALVLENGRPVILFQDLVAGGWYGQ